MGRGEEKRREVGVKIRMCCCEREGEEEERQRIGSLLSMNFAECEKGKKD